MASTGRGSKGCSSLLFLFSCSNERANDRVATRAGSHPNPLYTLYSLLYRSYSKYIRVVLNIILLSY
nr:MAG TPA: hypothetical protein [Caudoviricetes sp.]